MKPIRTLLLCLTILTVFAGIIGCDAKPPEPEETAEEADIPADLTPIYTVVRADDSPESVTNAAVKLRRALLDEYGIDLTLQTDWVNRGENVENHRFAHEILIGPTNRAESEAADAALNEGTPEMVNYTVTSTADHYVIAAADGCEEAAVEAFLAVLKDDLTLLSRPPMEISLSERHKFPLADLLIDGISVSEYDAIVCPDSYPAPAVDDVQELSGLIFEACGISLPVRKESEGNPARSIRLTDGADLEVASAGAYSYSMTFDENGLQLDGQNCWAAACALDLLKDSIREGMKVGGIISVDEPFKRLTDDREKLILSAWTLSAPDMTKEAQFAEIADCGFNQVMLANPSDANTRYRYMKWMTKYELQALWHDGSIRQTGDGNMTAGLAADYVKSDVTWGHMLRDEPSLSDFDMLAEIYRTYADQTGKVPFINLFPDYANEQQLGCKTYEEHLNAFFDTVKPAFSSVDIYPLNVGGIYDHYFGNLGSFSSACRSRGIPFGVYIQSVSFASSKRTPNEAELRWQAYCCLSFGATDIEYFTYRTPNSSTEDFKDALIGRDDGKTDAWYAAQKVNRELMSLSDAFLRYDNLGAFTVNAGSRAYMKFTEYTDFDALGEISVSGNRPLLIGAFTEKNGGAGRAFTCVNGSDPGSQNDAITVEVSLNDADSAVLYRAGTPSTLTADAEGKITFELETGEGVFITLNP